MHIAAEFLDLFYDLFKGKTLFLQFYQFLHDLRLTAAGGFGIDDMNLLLTVFFPIQIHSQHGAVVTSTQMRR